MCPRTAGQFEEIRKGSRQRILDAALKVFAKKGYYTASVSDIAKTARVSKGLMYNYFQSKEVVLRQLVMGMMERMMAQYMPVNPGEEITRAHVRRFINDGVDIVRENPHYWKLYFSVLMQPDVIALFMDELMEMAGPFMATMTKYFRKRGSKAPAAMMRYFSAVMDGVQLHIILDPEKFPAEQVKKMLIKQFA